MNLSHLKFLHISLKFIIENSGIYLTSFGLKVKKISDCKIKFLTNINRMNRYTFSFIPLLFLTIFVGPNSTSKPYKNVVVIGRISVFPSRFPSVIETAFSFNFCIYCKSVNLKLCIGYKQHDISYLMVFRI